MLVDTISFICKNKSCLRLILSTDEHKKFKSFCKNTDYKYFSEPILLKKKGNTWNSLMRNNSKEKIQNFLIVVSSNEESAFECLKAEINGDVQIAGKFFDYPKCCISYYKNILQSNPENWALSIIKSSGKGPFPYYANRIATGWGGINFIAELFPCSLKCKHAIKIGKKNEQAFHKLGLLKLAEKIKSHSLKPCAINRDGSVTKYINGNIVKDDEKLIYFSN